MDWQSVVAVGVVESAAVVRAALDELAIPFEKKKSTKLYTKFSFIISIPKGSYVFQFALKTEPPILIETWETELSPGARMAHLRIEGFTEAQREQIRGFLQLYRKGAGRDPWAFTFGERSRAGYLLPEFGRARQAWAEFGFETGRKPSRRRRRILPQ
jgi:hypothetical protein